MNLLDEQIIFEYTHLRLMLMNLNNISECYHANNENYTSNITEDESYTYNMLKYNIEDMRKTINKLMSLSKYEDYNY